MSGKTNIHDYAIAQMSRLLAKLAAQVQLAAETSGPDEIHDLRVSIRRFSQGLKLFSDFFPKAEVKKIRGTLKSIMELTSAIRDRDIAIEFLTEHKHAPHRPRLEKERGAYQRQFIGVVRRWNTQGFSAKWRTGLALGNV